jgi:hypothetical protein
MSTSIPDRGQSGLHTRGAIEFASTFLLLCALLMLPQCQTVPATGETRLTLISTAEEIRIGREADGGLSQGQLVKWVSTGQQ